jgi:hypothetical protein
LQNQTLVALQDGQASVCAGTQCTQLLKRGQTANVLREGGVTQIRRELTPSWTFASVCAGNATLCAPLPVQNLLKKAGLTTPALPGGKSAKNTGLTLLCPNGQPMTRGECKPTSDTLRDSSLPLLNGGTTRDSSLTVPNSPLAPSTTLPLDRGGTGLPQVSPSIGAPSLPSLRR